MSCEAHAYYTRGSHVANWVEQCLLLAEAEGTRMGGQSWDVSRLAGRMEGIWGLKSNKMPSDTRQH